MPLSMPLLGVLEGLSNMLIKEKGGEKGEQARDFREKPRRAG